MDVSRPSATLGSFSEVNHREFLLCSMFSNIPIPHSKRWSRALNQPIYMTTERQGVLDFSKTFSNFHISIFVPIIHFIFSKFLVPIFVTVYSNYFIWEKY